VLTTGNSIDAGSNTWLDMTIGASRTGGSAPNIAIGRIMRYGAVHTLNQREQVSQYLRNQFGL
jgi:hypothetical protein